MVSCTCRFRSGKQAQRNFPSVLWWICNIFTWTWPRMHIVFDSDRWSVNKHTLLAFPVQTHAAFIGLFPHKNWSIELSTAAQSGWYGDKCTVFYMIKPGKGYVLQTDEWLRCLLSCLLPLASGVSGQSGHNFMSAFMSLQSGTQASCEISFAGKFVSFIRPSQLTLFLSNGRRTRDIPGIRVLETCKRLSVGHFGSHVCFDH